MKEALEAEVRQFLTQEAEPSFRLFQQKLIPTGSPIYGVRMPKLRKKAKEMAKETGKAYLACQMDSLEEKLLGALVLGEGKMDFANRLSLLKDFLPKLDSWAVCDGLCSHFPVKTEEEREALWQFLTHYWDSPAEYDRRAAAVFSLSKLMTPSLLPRILSAYEKTDVTPYYVSMAVAWGVSVAYVHFPLETEVWLMETTLEVETYRRALQKIIESNRVDGETKERMRKRKREAR